MSREEPRGTSWGTRFAPGLAFLGVLLTALAATLVLREVSVGKAQMAAAEDAAARGAWADAIAHARGAAEAFVPGSPWAERGFEKLESIGHDATVRGDRPTALLAYGAVRSAALSTSAPGSSNSHWRSVAEDGLTHLATSEPEAVQLHSRPYDWTSAMRADLQRSSIPPVMVLAALSVSVFGILGAAAYLRRSAGRGPRAFVARLVIAAGLATFAAFTLLS